MHVSRFLRLIAALTATAAPLSTAGCGSGDDDCAATQPVTYDVPVSSMSGPDGGAASCEELCAGPLATVDHCSIGPGDGGQVAHCVATEHCGGLFTGRRPPGLAEGAPACSPSEIGALFAGYAYLEAASVPAFALVARELAAHGAPRGLVREATRAAGDERRHARTMRGLARRHGAVPARRPARRHALRDLEAFAVHNEVEGCVRETFGAVLAAWQARAAGDEAVRDALASVAPDEARHAALAWSIARWARPRLDAAARVRVDEARRAALREVRAGLEREPSVVVADRAGVPSAMRARALFDALFVALDARA
jgi:hypothetical protein